MNVKLLELLALYEKYINFIGKANEEPLSIAWTHGYKCKKEVYEEGVQFRDKIQKLQQEIHQTIIDSPQCKPEIMTKEFWIEMHKRSPKKD
jgi:hypothetical protein